MNKSEESMVESSRSMPVDVSGVALKEADFAFECHAFDTSGVGFDETVTVDHLTKKTY